MKRTRNLQSSTKVRVKKMPRSEKIVREWDADGWAYCLCQRPSGLYVIYAAEEDGDGWRIESSHTIKGALAAVRQGDADILSLMSVAE